MSKELPGSPVAGQPRRHLAAADVDTAPHTGTGSPPAVPGEPAQPRRDPLPAGQRSRWGAVTAGAVAGYRGAPGPERVLFAMTSSAAVTIAASRTLNYVRERRRAMPRVRNAGRLIAAVPASNALRVHHFLPGMAIGFATGATGLLARAGNLERWLALPFGVGLALVTDELPLLTGRSNPYWGREHFAIAQAATAAVAALGLGLRFLHRGHGTARAAAPTPAASA